MTQNNERELIVRLALVVIDLRRSHNGFDFIASLSELEAFAKAYKVAIDANDKSPISQNEQQEAVMKVTSNGSQLSLTRPDGTYWDMSKYIGQHFYTSTPKQIPDGWKLVPIEPTPEMLENVDVEIGCGGYNSCGLTVKDNHAKEVYKAMLNTSPTNTEVAKLNNKTITELEASNNQLREALEKIKECLFARGEDNYLQPIIQQALSSTPAQSLAEHDNEEK